MFLNGLTLAHYVGCISKLTIKDLTGVLPNLMGRGLTIPQYLFHRQSAQALPELIKAHKSDSWIEAWSLRGHFHYISNGMQNNCRAQFIEKKV